MSAPLRIALAYFSFAPVQLWINGLFGLLLGIFLVLGMLLDNQTGAAGFLVFAQVAAVCIAMAPAFAGGAMLRIVSSPLILRLRPHGRRQMLLGATATITAVALLLTLPVLAFHVAGLNIPGKTPTFALPTLGFLQFMWGATALLWIAMFIASRFPWLLICSFFLLVGVVRIAVMLVAPLHLTVDQVGTALLVIGTVAWALFALWYARTPSVVRPVWVAGLAQGQSPPDFGRVTVRRWFGRPAGEAQVSRPIALCQYLIGTDSTWPQVLIGAIFTAVLLVAYRLVPREASNPMPVFNLMYFTMFSAVLAPMIVRRARMLWLRTGLDRTELFAAAERHALRAELAAFSVPMAVFVSMSLVQRPDRAAGILLYVASQIGAATAFLYAGLTITRRLNVQGVSIFVVLGLLFIATSSALQSFRETPLWVGFAAVGLYGVLSAGLRWHASRRWRLLDWRLAGPPLPATARNRG